MTDDPLVAVRRRALVLAGLFAAATFAGVALAVVVVRIGFDAAAELAIVLVIGGAAAALVFFVLRAVVFAMALRRVQREHPGGIAMLALRQVSLVPDLPAYLRSRGISGIERLIADRWAIALIDERGMSAWLPTPRPRELLLMDWAEIRGVDVAQVVNTVDRRTVQAVTVDIAPYTTPLVVLLGYASFGVMVRLTRAEMVAVIAQVNALRPPEETA